MHVCKLNPATSPRLKIAKRLNHSALRCLGALTFVLQLNLPVTREREFNHCACRSPPPIPSPLALPEVWPPLALPAPVRRAFVCCIDRRRAVARRSLRPLHAAAATATARECCMLLARAFRRKPPRTASRGVATQFSRPSLRLLARETTSQIHAAESELAGLSERHRCTSACSIVRLTSLRRFMSGFQ